MSSFGEELGIAFQMIDDILDVTSDEATLGKKAGLDILERKPSLVNVLWLASGDPRAKKLLTPPPSDQSLEEDFIRDTLLELREGAIIAEARKLAIARAKSARTSLRRAVSGCPGANADGATALESVIDFALERVR
jgi:geranylgeranyl pyrophosphate synthase